MQLSKSSSYLTTACGRRGHFPVKTKQVLQSKIPPGLCPGSSRSIVVHTCCARQSRNMLLPLAQDPLANRMQNTKRRSPRAKLPTAFAREEQVETQAPCLHSTSPGARAFSPLRCAV